jgi:hypothetical protein
VGGSTRPYWFPAEELLPQIPPGEMGPGGLAAGAPLGGILTRPHLSSVEHLMLSRQKDPISCKRVGEGGALSMRAPRALPNLGVPGNPPLVHPGETLTLSEEETFPAVRALMKNPRLAPCWRTCWLS